MMGPLAPAAPAVPSQGEGVLHEFLNAMWTAQSDQKDGFRITAGVLEGLNYIFKLGVSVTKDQVFTSPDEVIARVQSTIPENIDTNIIKVLDRLPGKEKKLSARQKPFPRTRLWLPQSPVPGEAQRNCRESAQRLRRRGQGGFERGLRPVQQDAPRKRTGKVGQEIRVQRGRHSARYRGARQYGLLSPRTIPAFHRRLIFRSPTASRSRWIYREKRARSVR